MSGDSVSPEQFFSHAFGPIEFDNNNLVIKILSIHEPYCYMLRISGAIIP